MKKTKSVRPLDGIRVVDFTTLLPGPLASLMLARSGASVIKIESPDGDGMRQLGLGDARVDKVLFDLLNADKKSVSVDLKSPDRLEKVIALVRDADVVIEQFRPGVMERLGLGYEALSKLNPKLVYCSINGYGSTGPLAQRAGHDMNYMAETGILGLSPGADGSECVPPVLAADIAGGSYPAFFNILLALLARNVTGEGQHLDISMAESLFPFSFWALAKGWGEGEWPAPSSQMLNGGSARYRMYPAKDGRLMAVGAIEEKFWRTFCTSIGLPDHLADADSSDKAVIDAVSAIIASRTSQEWRPVFADADCCVNVVERLEDAVHSQHFRARGIFPDRDLTGEETPCRLPLPIAPALDGRAEPLAAGAPALGADDDLLERGWDGMAMPGEPA